jgi:hypothetical protein
VSVPAAAGGPAGGPAAADGGLRLPLSPASGCMWPYSDTAQAAAADSDDFDWRWLCGDEIAGGGGGGGGDGAGSGGDFMADFDMGEWGRQDGRDSDEAGAGGWL